MSRRAGHPRLLILLLTLLVASAAPLSWDPPEPSGRAASKIRVHPRGNLWATGHFMGKKSLEPPNPSPLESTPQISPRDRQLQLSPDLLRILFLKRALGLGHGNPAPSPQQCQKENGEKQRPSRRPQPEAQPREPREGPEQRAVLTLTCGLLPPAFRLDTSVWGILCALRN